MSKERNKPHDKKTCGAKTRAGTPCKRPAGWGTDHVGTGRCKLHGGKSTGPKDKTKVKGNKNAEVHGLYSKYFPKETMELFNAFDDKNPLDIMWDNIKIQFATIVRAQGIVGEKELLFNPAFNSNYLEAQSRAMTSLANMINQYEDMCKKGLATEEQKTRIAKLKAETKKLEIETSETDFSIDAVASFVEATTPSEADVKKLFEEEEQNG